MSIKVVVAYAFLAFCFGWTACGYYIYGGMFKNTVNLVGMK